jgi:tRNA 2-thiouridine synthesizing protein D
MKYAIQINDSPTRSGSSETCFQFIKAALTSGHEVVRVFFYHEGIYNAFIPVALASAAVPDWGALHSDQSIELVYCVSAAERRGQANACPGFVAGGLGLWVDACLRADRVIVFGS